MHVSSPGVEHNFIDGLVLPEILLGLGAYHGNVGTRRVGLHRPVLPSPYPSSSTQQAPYSAHAYKGSHPARTKPTSLAPSCRGRKNSWPRASRSLLLARSSRHAPRRDRCEHSSLRARLHLSLFAFLFNMTLVMRQVGLSECSAEVLRKAHAVRPVAVPPLWRRPHIR